MPAASSANHATTRATTIFGILLALRLANALLVRTFFQPDEYFQALEPAWQLAFGKASGAWITWEWRNQLRSSLHPLVFSCVYRAGSVIAALGKISPAARSRLLLSAPKAAQAVMAATIDFFTWRTAQRCFGANDRAAWTTLALTVLSPWQWFCSVRTLSNSAETALTAAALSAWPWTIGGHPGADDEVTSARDRPAASGGKIGHEGEFAISKLRISLLLAAIATVLRPTNLLIWAPLGIGLLGKEKATWKLRLRLIGEALACGSFVLLVSALVDRWYYGLWTFPPLRFVHFNVNQGLAVFYGTNRWDYYFTEGLPLLLTTALLFAVGELYRGLRLSDVGAGQGRTRNGVLRQLSWTVVFVIASLSCISHKEVRFLYPTLPALHVIAAGGVARFAHPRGNVKRIVLLFLIVLNLIVAFYTTQVHQRGVIDVVDFLRAQHEAKAMTIDSATSSVGFLMPCHSTPWRSHLVHSDIAAWALTCEPPIDVPLESRASYMDEADVFYANPHDWLATNMQDAKAAKSKVAPDGKRVWPDYLVFFEQLEPIMTAELRNTEYSECWRGFNSHWHDDWRRRGDVIVWCKR